MIPAARISAAIEILDAILAGNPAEPVLSNWGRANRYAGSGDRAAIRDHVFDALRRRRSAAWAGGAETGRGLMLGLLRLGGVDPAGLFTGSGHAPAIPSPDEAGREISTAPAPVRLDCPDWLWPLLKAALGEDLEPALRAQQSRAPVFLRVNLARSTLDHAARLLASDGIGTRPVNGIKTALEVTENPRKVSASVAYAQGHVELQDAASQALCLALAPQPGLRVLDYCAGGGGKALALAALGAEVSAHDAIPRRMADLPARANRAGVKIPILPTPVGTYDLVLTDVPCSGSGTWARDPQGKWALDADALQRLTETQDSILAEAAPLVAPGGRLAYATCSLLRAENEDRADHFLSVTDGWKAGLMQRFLPGLTGDGFFVATFRRL